MTFRVGQKVVCVRGPYEDIFCKVINHAKVGDIYTIRAIRTDVSRPELGVSLLFEEVINSMHKSGTEYGFYSSRFRPIVERETDISIFTAMLTPAQKKERA